MKNVTFQVLEGVDKGRVFRQLPIPVTIGREEGNLLRLNDERVSRYHAKVQLDGEDVILTDLDSTNGTRVNGFPVQIRRLRAGDQICIGRSILLFGSHDDIAVRGATIQTPNVRPQAPVERTFADQHEPALDLDLDLNLRSVEPQPAPWRARDKDLPPVPEKMSPAQSAYLAEIFEFLHQGLSEACEAIQANDEGTVVRMPFVEWQKIQAVQGLLARYLRAVAEPDSLSE